MAKTLCIRSLRRGVGSMDYIHSLLIAEDDLDEDDESLGTAEMSQAAIEQMSSHKEGTEERNFFLEQNRTIFIFSAYTGACTQRGFDLKLHSD